MKVPPVELPHEKEKVSVALLSVKFSCKKHICSVLKVYCRIQVNRINVQVNLNKNPESFLPSLYPCRELQVVDGIVPFRLIYAQRVSKLESESFFRPCYLESIEITRLKSRTCLFGRTSIKSTCHKVEPPPWPYLRKDNVQRTTFLRGTKP
jgi:hypothetical protein